jgi:hypothetical protein
VYLTGKFCQLWNIINANKNYLDISWCCKQMLTLF